MASIVLDKCSLHLPIYGTINRSLKGAVLSAATGGKVATNARDVVVVQALNQLDMSFKSGDRVGLYGHNGAGKTSLLRLIAGIYEPTSGQIQVEGRISSLLDVTLGMDPEATGYENIKLRGLILGLTTEQIDTLTPSIVDFSGLGEFVGVPVRTYSSGMVLRLAFSIVTSIHPDILLLDEWLSVGDADFVQKAEERMRSLVDSASILVLASHSRSVIDDVCNIVVTLEHGKIISVERKEQQASPE